jgi:ketosteroid isomerase-like protein
MQNNTEDQAMLIAMYDDALHSFAKGDLEAVLQHWEDDGAYLWPAVPPAIGKQEIRAAYEGFFQNWRAEEIFHRHELTVSGDMGFCRFGTELTLYPKSGGPPANMTLQGIHIYKKRGDGWRFKCVIAIDIPSL